MNNHKITWGEESAVFGITSENKTSDVKITPANTTAIHEPKKQFIAEKIYRLRRKREKLFSADIFSDPAWDILLDLYISENSGKEISITSACLAAGVPASTGLRWITILIQNGYVERREDPTDARRSLVSLTQVARTALESLFEQLEDERSA